MSKHESFFSKYKCTNQALHFKKNRDHNMKIQIMIISNYMWYHDSISHV